ncbi:hypothetical protein LY78DRAFT_206774 [Colletotrichum sublineola]|nr:hypothetical protein LY78DRAFT_206774 [Colletotrichum sublineola]
MRCRDETRRRRRLAPVLWDQPCTPRCPSSRVAQQWAPSGLWRRYLFVPCTIGIAHNRFLYDLSYYCPRHGSRPAASAGSVLNSSGPCYKSRLERPLTCSDLEIYQCLGVWSASRHAPSTVEDISQPQSQLVTAQATVVVSGKDA